MVCAWISGTFLLLLVAEMITRYGLGYDLIAGGTGNNRTAKVSEGHLLDLEREAFLTLLGKKGTQQRIEHMLKTGKPLRN